MVVMVVNRMYKLTSAIILFYACVSLGWAGVRQVYVPSPPQAPGSLGDETPNGEHQVVVSGAGSASHYSATLLVHGIRHHGDLYIWWDDFQTPVDHPCRIDVISDDNTVSTSYHIPCTVKFLQHDMLSYDDVILTSPFANLEIQFHYDHKSDKFQVVESSVSVGQIQIKYDGEQKP